MHVVPPNGGFGGNTGVHDAHNLAWKLALVLNGTAGPGLLATYDAERRPVGEFTVEQSYARYVGRVAPYLGTAGAQPVVDDLYLELGYRYESPPSSPNRGDGDAGRRASAPAPARLTGQPGSRAPHVFLDRDGARLSTLDLFGRNFVLLAGTARRRMAGRGTRRGANASASGSTPTRWPAERPESRRPVILAGDGNSLPLGLPDGTRTAPSWSARTASSPGAPRTAPGATAEVMTAVLSRVLHREDA